MRIRTNFIFIFSDEGFVSLVSKIKIVWCGVVVNNVLLYGGFNHLGPIPSSSGYDSRTLKRAQIK